MSKTRRVQAQDRYITRTECHALIVHVINQVFAQMAEQPTTEPSDITAAMEADRQHQQSVQHAAAAIMNEHAPALEWLATR